MADEETEAQTATTEEVLNDLLKNGLKAKDLDAKSLEGLATNLTKAARAKTKSESEVTVEVTAGVTKDETASYFGVVVTLTNGEEQAVSHQRVYLG